MALNVTQVHRNLQQRVTFLGLEFEDLFVVLGLAALTGSELVLRRYGTIDIDAAPVSPEHRVHYVAEAPPVFFGHTPLQIAASLLLPAATAALVYGLCATWSTRDDLGGYPPEPAPRPTPVWTPARINKRRM